jgi:hypothetical protein
LSRKSAIALGFSKNGEGELITMVASTVISNSSQVLSLEEWMENPPVGTEWVDGTLLVLKLSYQVSV